MVGRVSGPTRDRTRFENPVLSFDTEPRLEPGIPKKWMDPRQLPAMIDPASWSSVRRVGCAEDTQAGGSGSALLLLEQEGSPSSLRVVKSWRAIGTVDLFLGPAPLGVFLSSISDALQENFRDGNPETIPRKNQAKCIS